MKIEGSEAFEGAIRNKMRKYPDRVDPRYDDHFIYPSVAPKFSIKPTESVFTIGSCFARNVEEALVSNGVNVPTAGFVAPHEEAPGRPNRILNQYNLATMLQCVKAADQPVNERGLYETASGDVIDCLLATGSRSVTIARARERRAQINSLYLDGLADAGVVVVTLGLVEAWYDNEHGIYLNEAPPRQTISKDKGRFIFNQLGVDECRSMLFELLELLIGENRLNIILTVSPVPLQVTFAGGDAVIANSYSKAVLRVVAEMASQSFSRVDYYPSYEIVTTGGLRSYGDDNVHVRNVVVQRIVDHMVSLYIA